MAQVLISDSENINMVQLKDQGSTAPTPNSGFKRLYVKSGGLYYVDSTGTEHEVMEVADLATITLTAGIGLSGGGTIAANRTFDLDLNDLTTEASPATGDYIPIVDISESNALNKTTIADILSLASGGIQLAIGTYTGNAAATKAVTGVGFQPSLVFIYIQLSSANSPLHVKTSSDGLYAYFTQSGGKYETDFIISLDADGFTVGDGTPLGVAYTNFNGSVYTYIAIG